MKLFFSTFLLLIVYFFLSVNGANILGVFNHPGGSHTYLGKVLLKKLASHGHKVVMISSFPLKNAVPNYEDIYLAGPLEDLNYRNKKKKNTPMSLDDIRNMTLQHTEDTFRHEKVIKLMQSSTTFDLIIIDWFFNEATLIFGHIFQAPVIYLSSFGNMALIAPVTGNVLPYSYVPGAAKFMDDQLTFSQRCFMTIVNILNYYFITQRNQAHYALLERYFDNPPTIQELQDNVALVLSNSHFSFETPRPYTPNIIPVGGFHIEEPKQLSQDLQEYLDSATDGIILFSLGSQLESSDFEESMILNLVHQFGQLKQKVIWKLNGTIPNLPKNIKIVKWLPQTEILAHQNVKLFITHGGMLSVIESVYFGVPLLCLPFNGDQITNAAFIQSRKIGLYLSPSNITAKNVYEAIIEILENSEYQETSRYRSGLLRNQPVKPIDLAIYWINHVLEHKHGNHLKTYATKLPVYKYFMLDVIVFFASLFFVAMFACFICIKKIVVCISRKIRSLGACNKKKIKLK